MHLEYFNCHLLQARDIRRYHKALFYSTNMMRGKTHIRQQLNNCETKPVNVGNISLKFIIL